LIALEVPRLCPLVLLVKLGWREDGVLESEVGRVRGRGLVMQQRKEAEIAG
jgi:hypothetical protein